MSSKADLTQERILSSARKEFLQAGFHNASMRRIASEANVTTGAVYRYFADKDTLFQEATKDAVHALHNLYSNMTDIAFDELEAGNTYDRNRSMANLTELFEVVYEYFDQFYLLVMCSKDSIQESFLHKIVEEETACTLEYLERLKKQIGSDYEIDKTGLHIVIEAFVSALLEPVRHRMSKEEAMKHIVFIGNFFADGWAGVEGELTRTETKK